MKKDTKTNVMRALDGKKIPYKSHTYELDAAMRHSLLEFFRHYTG